MNGLEFTASLVHSLAWPLSIVFVAWLLRRQLAALLDVPLDRLKIGPFEAEWNRTAREVAKSVPRAAKERATTDHNGSSQDLLTLTESAPDVAVEESFALLDTKVRKLAADAGIDADRRSVVELAEDLAKQGAMSAESAHAVRGMVVLRNLAAHSRAGEPATTPEKAREYVELSDATLFTLEAPPKSATSRSRNPSPR